MRRPKTWKVLQWTGQPDYITDSVPLQCPCGRDAECPVGPLPPGKMVIACFGMRLVFDPGGYTPPQNYMPDSIQCRKCGRVFKDRGTVDNERETAVTI